MFEKKSFPQFAENSVIYRHLRDYFNNPVKRKQILKGQIYIVSLDNGDCVGLAFTFIDAQLYRIYCLLLRELRYCYDDGDQSRPIAYFDRKFGFLVDDVAPHFGWRL